MLSMDGLTVNIAKSKTPLTKGEAYNLLHQDRMCLIALLASVSAYKSGDTVTGDARLEAAREALQAFDQAMVDLVFDVNAPRRG